jgi:hypothetical protein
MQMKFNGLNNFNNTVDGTKLKNLLKRNQTLIYSDSLIQIFMVCIQKFWLIDSIYTPIIKTCSHLHFTLQKNKF